MEGSCSTGQSPQRAVVPVEEEEEEEELNLCLTRHIRANRIHQTHTSLYV
jgi:hypothetical protein